MKKTTQHLIADVPVRQSRGHDCWRQLNCEVAETGRLIGGAVLEDAAPQLFKVSFGEFG
jgi:hypothetical protein